MFFLESLEFSSTLVQDEAIIQSMLKGICSTLAA